MPKEDNKQTSVSPGTGPHGGVFAARAFDFEAGAREDGAAFMAVMIFTAAGQPVYIDPLIPSMLGYEAGDPELLNPSTILANPHDHSAFVAELRQNGAVKDFETSLKRADGRIVPASVNVHKMEIGGSAHVVVMLQSVDGSRIRQQQSDARYHLIFNSVPVGITITDTQGNFYAFNPALNEMLGFTDAEFRDMKSDAVYRSKADRKRFVDILTREKTVRNFETVFVRKDGRAIHVLLNSDIIGFGSLQNAMFSSVRDITPLKSIEAELIKERDFSEAVLDTSDSLIMVFDRDGIMIRFNKACEKTAGYSLAELQETPFFDLLSPDPQDAKQRIARMIRTRECESFENYWKTRDGRMLLIKWTSAVLKDEDGSDYIVSTGSDITERRKAHEALRTANRELETSLRRLEERNQAISLLADMEGFLQGCRTVEEACTICTQFVQSICPQTSGAVYLIDDLNGTAEPRDTWGDESLSQKRFPFPSCWSIRHGRMNRIDPDHHGMPCPHIRGVNGQFLCVPMEANGKILGILHLSYICDINESLTPADCPPYFEPKLRLITTAAETAALSLSNIMLQETLRQQSIRDPLTGIYNRRYMVESLTRELSRAQREHASVSVLMFDIDTFKDFNDTYGHDGGDALLRLLGDYLRQNTRGEDIICRFGGEEFVVVLPNTRHQDAVLKAEVIRGGISRLEISHLGKPLHNCTVSIGVASYPHNGHTADALLKAADDALYAAKREGRNRVIACACE